MTPPAFHPARLAPDQVEVAFTYAEQLAKLLRDRGLYTYVYRDSTRLCEVVVRRTDVRPWTGLIVRVLPHPRAGDLHWHWQRLFTRPSWKQDPTVVEPVYFQLVLPVDQIARIGDLVVRTLEVRLARRSPDAALAAAGAEGEDR